MKWSCALGSFRKNFSKKILVEKKKGISIHSRFIEFPNFAIKLLPRTQLFTQVYALQLIFEIIKFCNNAAPPPTSPSENWINSGFWACCEKAALSFIEVAAFHCVGVRADCSFRLFRTRTRRCVGQYRRTRLHCSWGDAVENTEILHDWGRIYYFLCGSWF